MTERQKQLAHDLNEALRLSKDFWRVEKLALSFVEWFEASDPCFNRSKFLAIALA